MIRREMRRRMDLRGLPRLEAHADNITSTRAVLPPVLVIVADGRTNTVDAVATHRPDTLVRVPNH